MLAPCHRLVLILPNWAVFCQTLRWCKIMKNEENLFREGTNKKSFSPDSFPNINDKQNHQVDKSKLRFTLLMHN